MCSRPCSAPGQVGLDFLLREIRGGLLGQVGLDFLLREIRGGLLPWWTPGRGGGQPPKKATLQKNAKRVKPETWKQINDLVVLKAKALGIENGAKVRTDCSAARRCVRSPCRVPEARTRSATAGPPRPPVPLETVPPP